MISAKSGRPLLTSFADYMPLSLAQLFFEQLLHRIPTLLVRFFIVLHSVDAVAVCLGDGYAVAGTGVLYELLLRAALIELFLKRLDRCLGNELIVSTVADQEFGLRSFGLFWCWLDQSAVETGNRLQVGSRKSQQLAS